MTVGALRPGTIMPLPSTSGLFLPCRDILPESAFFRLSSSHLLKAMKASVDKTQGNAFCHAVHRDQDPHRPAIGIFHRRSEDLAIAAYGQQQYPDADWLLIPDVPGNAFLQGGRVFVHSGVAFERDEAGGRDAAFMMFDRPARMDRIFSMVPFEEEIQDRLISLGHPVVNPVVLSQITDNKALGHLIYDIAGIQSPRFVLLSRNEGHTAESIEATIHRFISERGISNIVVKPAAGSLGEGVHMFAAGEIRPAAGHARDLLEQWDKILVEERIISRRLMIDGTRMDWNIRVVIPPGELSGWDILDTSEVRFNEFNGNPVNKSRGAKIEELGAILDRIRVSARERSRIVSGLYDLSHRIRTFLSERLREKAGASADLYEPILGLDVIVDENFNLFMIEINSGIVGGLGSLIDIRDGGAKFRSIDILTRNLFDSVRKKDRASHLPDVDDGCREYLEDHYSWLTLWQLLANKGEYRNALAVAERAVEISPDNSDALYAKGAMLTWMGSSLEALRHLQRAIELIPDDPATKKLKADVLTDLFKIVECMPPLELKDAIEQVFFPDQITADQKQPGP